jgi:hypothetical protein
MRILIKVFKYTVFSACVSLATCVIALFIGIFFILHQKAPENRVASPVPQGSISDIAAATLDKNALPPPEAQVLEHESRYQKAIEQLKFIETVEDDARQAPLKNICDIICVEPRFKTGHLDFVSFYGTEGRRSFDDADFRLQLESFLLIKKLFPAQTLQLVSDISGFDPLGKSLLEKASTALRIEGQVLREIFIMGRQMPVLKKQNDHLSAIKKLRKQCTATTVGDIQASCASHAEALNL